jgi:hypothetical protein
MVAQVFLGAEVAQTEEGRNVTVVFNDRAKLVNVPSRIFPRAMTGQSGRSKDACRGYFDRISRSAKSCIRRDDSLEGEHTPTAGGGRLWLATLLGMHPHLD